MAETVKVIPNQTFLHGRERYEKGRLYDADQFDAYLFANNGWLAGVEGADDAVTQRLAPMLTERPRKVEPVTLDVHDGQIGHTSEVK